MKKYFILAAAAVVALASCQKNDGTIQNVNDAVEGTPVGFSAYTPQTVTKGAIVTGAELDSIGVFAFYQQNANGQKVNFNTHRYSVPDFMYNQLVSSDYDGSKFGAWTYSPVKYWPNNEGDQLSFFAYAPYDKDKTWEDLGVSTDAVGKNMTVSFPIYNKVSDQVDYLWATPQINKANASTVETGGYAVGGKVTFDFKHITSQISLYIGAENDATTGKPSAWRKTYADTTLITVDKIVFKGMGEEIKFSYVLPAAADSTITVEGSQDIVLTSVDFQNDSSKFWNTADKFETLIDSVKVGTKYEPGFMFVAPMTATELAEAEIEFTYTVYTKDLSRSGKTENDSKITNVITRKWSDFVGTTPSSITALEAGKAYKLNILIGMNTVDFDASETAWVDGGTYQVDIPKNK